MTRTSETMCVRAVRRMGVAALMVSVGCGPSGPDRVVVSGEVTYRGEPVAEGVVRFQPIEGTRSPVSISPINDGRYEADALGGVMVGTYQVQIRAYQPTDKPRGGLGPLPPQLLPPKYNTESELKLTVPPDSGRIKQDYHLDE